MPREVDTELARLELASPTLVVVHVKPDVKITVQRVFEIVHVRRSLVAGVPGAMYFIAPGELDWEAAALATDFFAPEGDSVKALSVMVNAPIFSTVVNLYFGLFPEKFPGEDRGHGGGRIRLAGEAGLHGRSRVEQPARTPRLTQTSSAQDGRHGPSNATGQDVQLVAETCLTTCALVHRRASHEEDEGFAR